MLDSWLTLIVQSLTQLTRVVNGQSDYRLTDMATHLARYFSIFQDFEDRKLFAEMMIPLTGTKMVNLRPNGQPEYLPVAAEQDQNERRFAQLVKRQVLIWDREEGQRLRQMRSPYVPLAELPINEMMGQLVMFETEHLQRTGRPAYLIRKEIADRQQQVMDRINKNAARPVDPEAPAHLVAPTLEPGRRHREGHAAQGVLTMRKRFKRQAGRRGSSTRGPGTWRSWRPSGRPAT